MAFLKMVSLMFSVKAPIVTADEQVYSLYSHVKRFSLRELQIATHNFSRENILSWGKFGTIYKGRFDNGSMVAIKRLSEGRMHTQGWLEQFLMEIEFSSVALHRNILQLLGIRTTSAERILVYPYMANGSVASHLKEQPIMQPALDWEIRKRIALGSARGLAYLHDDCVPTTIHRDFKAENILLDEEFEVVIGAFGLVKPMDCEETHVTTAVRGIIGNVAPEYFFTGKRSPKTDVYGYGVLLLELITGQRAFDLARLANDDQVLLLDWVKGLLKEKMSETLPLDIASWEYDDYYVRQLQVKGLLKEKMLERLVDADLR